VPLERAEEARADWLERFPAGFEEVEVGAELELAAYTDAEAPAGARVEQVDAGWEDRWRDFHRPIRAGAFWVGPPWHEPPGDSLALVIDPGRAFGTGAHATTRLCLELLAGLTPTSLLDVGCGSGVLAVAAARLGFAPVVAVDSDPTAVEETQRNAAANCVAVVARTLDATSDPLPAAEVILANISRALVEVVLTRIEARIVVASGYLEGDELALGPYARRERRSRDGWAADLLERSE
jgi:ribosomal protein L11 methyltransferase